MRTGPTSEIPASARRRRAAHALTLTLIGLLLTAVVFAPVPGESRGIRVLHDGAHGLVFGVIGLLLLTLQQGHGPGRRSLSLRYALPFSAATVLGAATELAQLAAGGDASWIDAGTDALGAAAFLASFAAIDRNLRCHPHERRLRATALLSSFALAAILTGPLVTAAAAYAKRAREFPALVGFGGWPVTYFIGSHAATVERVTLPAPWASEGAEPALRVVFGSEGHPGIDLFEPVSDWRGYQSLAIDLTNPTPLPLTIVLRVHDGHRRHGQNASFDRGFLVPARTRTTLRVPLDQIESAPGSVRMDLQHMAGVIINGSPGSEARVLYLSGIWLEKQGG